MLLTRTEFDQKHKDGSLAIALVGMSNIGKSIRAGQLEDEFGFTRHSVDDVIAQKLKKGNMAGMVEWMGYPFESQYKEAEDLYLDLENKMTLSRNPQIGNFVLDTTGSVVYLEPKTLAQLREDYLIINLDCSGTMLKPMIEEFFLTPKTIVWANHFQKQENEKEIDALRRCYPNLLKDRIKRYRELGDIHIPGELSRSPKIVSQRFWEIIRLTLPE
jgi:shikimate kinase